MKMMMHVNNPWIGSYVSKMKTGTNGFIVELVQKQEKIQIYNKYKNIILVKFYMLNKIDEKSRRNRP